MAGHQVRTTTKSMDRRERCNLGHGGSPAMGGSSEKEEVDVVEAERTGVEVVVRLQRRSARRKRPMAGRRSGQCNGGTHERRGGGAGHGEGIAAR
jgi:hypothetical protein